MDEALHAADEVRRLWPFFDVADFVAMFDAGCQRRASLSVCQANRAVIAGGLHKAGLK
jgi:hypothetical protein